ncbi:hypothetical protein MWH30_07945 [Fuchsiella alkaliacetigena]|nr:hypothetical protein [Fuchsiella alkaliacetigena]
MKSSCVQDSGVKKQRKELGMRQVLQKLSQETDTVTVIIESGEGCCEITGCIASIKGNILTMFVNNADDDCPRVYIAIDCICAVYHPAI